MADFDASGGRGTRPKAKAKTPLQKEVLEASYQLNNFPTEEHRAALGERIGLTENQVQVWFGHRRRKDKKPGNYGDGRQGHTPGRRGPKPKVIPATTGRAPSKPAQVDETVPLELTEEQLELLEMAKSTLEVTFRSDGPALALYFDSVPTSKGAAPPKRKRSALYDEYEVEETPVKVPRSKRKAPVTVEYGSVYEMQEAVEKMAQEMEALKAGSEERVKAEVDMMEQLEKELNEASTKEDGDQSERLHQALAQQTEVVENVKLQEAEHVQAETERIETEKAALVEKIEKEQARDHMKTAKEAERARKEAEKDERRAENAKAREAKKEETRRQLEEKKKEKELIRMLQQQEKQSGLAPKTKGHDSFAGPPDDAELEYETLLLQWQEKADDANEACATPPPCMETIERPEFPPPSIALSPAFPPHVEEDIGADMLMAWSFLNNFSDVMGLPVIDVNELVSAVALGERSPLLQEVFVALIRVVQADMEEAHATGASQVRRTCVEETVALGKRSALLPDVFVALNQVVQSDMEEAHATGASQVRRTRDR
eukprot:gene8199-1461_t